MGMTPEIALCRTGNRSLRAEINHTRVIGWADFCRYNSNSLSEFPSRSGSFSLSREVHAVKVTSKCKVLSWLVRRTWVGWRCEAWWDTCDSIQITFITICSCIYSRIIRCLRHGFLCENSGTASVRAALKYRARGTGWSVRKFIIAFESHEGRESQRKELKKSQEGGGLLKRLRDKACCCLLRRLFISRQLRQGNVTARETLMTSKSYKLRGRQSGFRAFNRSEVIGKEYQVLLVFVDDHIRVFVASRSEDGAVCFSTPFRRQVYRQTKTFRCCLFLDSL